MERGKRCPFAERMGFFAGGAVPDESGMSGGGEVSGHGGAHSAESDKADLGTHSLAHEGVFYP